MSHFLRCLFCCLNLFIMIGLGWYSKYYLFDLLPFNSYYLRYFNCFSIPFLITSLLIFNFKFGFIDFDVWKLSPNQYMYLTLISLCSFINHLYYCSYIQIGLVLKFAIISTFQKDLILIPQNYRFKLLKWLIKNFAIQFHHLLLIYSLNR